MAAPNSTSAYIRERTRLAISYVEDGAPASAARVLRDLAETVQKRADAVNAALADIMKKNQ